ncbi:MAG: DUF4387 domain-containing protein [Haloferacaceae archaeon]
MTTLGDLASIVRSKNAGPFRLTFDVFFPDEDAYRRVADGEVVTEAVVADVFGIPAADVLGVYHLDDLRAVKVSIARPTPAGSFEETDVYGTQQATPLLTVEVPDGE